MADTYALEKSVSDLRSRHEFVDKEVIYIQDSNGGSYNSQINIDTSVISSSGRWADYSESFLQIPYSVNFKSSVDITAIQYSGFMVGMKAGNHQILDSIQVQLNNASMVGVQSLSNVYWTFKMLTTWSRTDVAKWGAITGFIPDSAGSWKRSAAGALDGQGYSNNRVYPATAPSFTLASVLDAYNAGLYERLKSTAYAVITPTQTGTASLPVLGTSTARGQLTAVNRVAKSFFADDGGAAAARVYGLVLNLTIRMKDICDLFAQLPLSRGLTFAITLNYNSCNIVVDCVTDTSMIAQLPSMVSGRTVPFIIPSFNTNEPNDPLITGAYTFQATVGKTVQGANMPLSISACRLYVPCYRLSPQAELELLSDPVKQIEYTDIFSYPVTGITSGASTSAVLTNGIANIQRVIVCPFIASGSEANLAGLTPILNPFSTCPGTLSPLLGSCISDFNVSVSGTNMFQLNQQYGFDQFMNEMVRTGIDGGSQIGLCSGLIDKYNWENAYGYFVCDVSRRMDIEDNTNKSVQINLLNGSAVTIDLQCFIELRKSFLLDLRSGAVILN